MIDRDKDESINGPLLCYFINFKRVINVLFMSDHLPFAVSSVSFGDIQEFSKIIPSTGTVTL